MRKSLVALAVLGALSFQAQAGVVCNNCAYLQGQVATNLGLHQPPLFDNSTFGNATTGFNGNFTNDWAFSISPAGRTSIDAIFLPIQNISNFDVKLFSVTSETCAPNGPTTGGLCTALVLGAMLADGVTNPAFATEIDFTTLAAGNYAFVVTGTISNLVSGQPASYTGNLQTQPIPEPGTLALASLALVAGLGLSRRRKS